MLRDMMPGARKLADGLKRTVVYWMETEVHVYGFAIAANVLLSYFPFLIVMVSLCRHVLHWPEAERAVYIALRDYFPGELGQYLPMRLQQVVNARGPMQWISIVLLFFTANGVFEPLEVALNRVWGIRANRNFLMNQVISMALIFGCGALVFGSTLMTAVNQNLVRELFGTQSALVPTLTMLMFKVAAVPATIFCLFLIYWLLPNGRIPLGRVLPAAVIVGLLMEVFKWLLFWSWPWTQEKLREEYGVFYVSVAIVLMSFFASMLVLAGAEWAAREPGEPEGSAVS
jgi:YihY family inner membrane protein